MMTVSQAAHRRKFEKESSGGREGGRQLETNKGRTRGGGGNKGLKRGIKGWGGGRVKGKYGVQSRQLRLMGK